MRRTGRYRRRVACAIALAPVALTISATTAPTSAAETRGANFEANRGKVPFAGSVTLRGAFRERYSRPATVSASGAGKQSTATRPASGRQVRIEYKVAGASTWKVIGRTRTGSRGRFKKGIKLRRTGYVRARLADGTVAGKRRIRVASRMRSKIKRKHIDAGRATKIVGRINPGTSRRKVIVKVGKQRKSTRTRSGGRFSVRVPVRSIGTRKVTVKAKSDRAAAGDRGRPGKVTAYRRALASWYGPGFYGNRTACGQVLGYDTVGVAHKTMPCGTKLKIRYGKRTITTRVIDRGPYHGAREFDLTGAAKRKLGFGSTGYVQVNR